MCTLNVIETKFTDLVTKKIRWQNPGKSPAEHCLNSTDIGCHSVHAREFSDNKFKNKFIYKYFYET